MTYKEAMDVLGVSYTTLKRYVKRGLIRVYKYQMPGMSGKNNYFDEDVYALLGHKWTKNNWIVGYVRVAGAGSKHDAKLAEQKELMRKFCTARGIQLEKIYEDRGASTEFSRNGRPSLHEMLKEVIQGRIQAVVVDRHDRISRVAPEIWEIMFKYHSCDLVVMNPALEDPYYQEEQSKDLSVLIERARLERSGELGKGTRGKNIRSKPGEGPAGENKSPTNL